ncbi:MAG: hypothetical protein AMXMBFR47_25310 [Planctomycetota bacterium]
MDSERFRKVEEIFTRASQLARGERTRFIQLECGEDGELRAEVEALLTHDDRPPDYLRTPLLDAGLTLRDQLRKIAAQQPHSEIPERIGAYRPKKIIGEGGFGVVYLAEQDMPRRTVALKVLRPGFATRNVLKRFEYEAQVLGRLHHPGIAQVYEAGTALVGDRPQAFVAMEYIAGLPLTQYAREKKIGIRERLELIARICDAVQHAHQKGIIHRDLKPLNILVVEEDATTAIVGGSGDSHARYTALRAQPKILDFGVARATDPDLSSTTLQTGVGQLVGTLPYMSPEQVAGDPAEIDTRSDVYSIGVLLYELLTGRLPYDLGSKAIPDAARVIREQAPTRLGSINRHLRGEIDTIVQEALEKDKKRRYQSAAALGEDIRRYLRGEPIAAKRDSALYVIRKQLKRYWAATTVAATFVVMLIAFAVYASLQSRMFRTLAERESVASAESLRLLGEARVERQRADMTAAELQSQLIAANIERGRLLGRTGALSAAENLIWPEHLRNHESTHTYWALWELYAREPWLTAFNAHNGNVTGCRFTPDGRYLITAGMDGKIRFWDPSSWACIDTIAAHTRPIRGFSLNPDGSRLATSAADEQLIIWDVGRRIPIRKLPGLASEMTMVAFSPDGRHLASVGIEFGAVRIFDAETGELAASLPISPRGAHTVVYSPLGRELAASVRDNTIRVWPDPLGDAQKSFALRIPSGSAGNIAYSETGRRLFGGGDERIFRAWDLDTREIAGVQQSPNDTVSTLTYVPARSQIATTGWWAINLWNPETLSLEQTYMTPEGTATFDFSGDGRFLALGATSGDVRVLELESRGSILRFDGHESRSTSRISPDGSLLAVGDARGNLRIWDVARNRPLATWRAHGSRIHAIRFDPRGGPLIATAAADRLLKIWNLETGACVDSFFNIRTRTSSAFDWSPDGRRIAFMGNDQYLHMIDTGNWTESGAFYVDAGEMLGVAFGHKTEILATTTRGDPLHVWSFDGRRLASFSTGFSNWTPAFSPDDSLVATGTWAWEIEVYDWRRNEEVARLTGHSSTVWTIEFDPRNPRLIASSASDGTTRLFDVYDQRALLTLDALSNSELLSTSYTADGSRLAVSNSLGQAVVYDLTYFARHIAGQVERQARRLPEDDPARAEISAWSREVLNARRLSDSAEAPDTLAARLRPFVVHWAAAFPRPDRAAAEPNSQP